MKKQLTTLAILIIAGIAGFGLYNAAQDSDTADQQIEVSEQIVESSQITISDDGKSATYDGVAGETALTTLNNLTNVETENSSVGEFVVSINGLVADSNSEYWAFYVNGELASEGAGTYETVTGDNIEWKLESF